MEYVKFGGLGLVSIISPSSELKTMYHFFCWIPYSLNNSLTKFDNFLSTESTGWEPAQPVQWIAVEVHYSSKFKFRAAEFVLVISPSFGLEIIHRLFFLDFLLFKEHFFKFSNFFSTFAMSWELVQLDHCPSLCGALTCVILEPKSYLVRAHKLNIRPRNGLVPVLGHFLGCFQPTFSPFGFLVVKQRDKCGQLLTS